MGNDQLLPGYNVQLAICDEYIATYDIQQFASDMDCFLPLMCPNNKEFHFLRNQCIKGNTYGRSEELWICEDCSECPYSNVCKKAAGNRVIRLNRELSGFHKEVIYNLECVQGALLRMNRSIQAEGAFGTIKWNRSYMRARRRGLKQLILEIGMISCGFNLHKYHLRKINEPAAA